MKIDLTNYVPLMCTIMIIMAILLIVMSIGLLRMKSQYKSQRKLVKMFCGENRTEKGIYVHIFSAVGMVLFTAGELGMAILMLEKV